MRTASGSQSRRQALDPHDKVRYRERAVALADRVMVGSLIDPIGRVARLG